MCRVLVRLRPLRRYRTPLHRFPPVFASCEGSRLAWRQEGTNLSSVETSYIETLHNKIYLRGAPLTEKSYGNNTYDMIFRSTHFFQNIKDDYIFEKHLFGCVTFGSGFDHDAQDSRCTLTLHRATIVLTPSPI